MNDYEISLPAADVVALDAALRAQFGAAISGVSYNGALLRIHFFDAPTAPQQASALDVVNAHDPVLLAAVRAGDTVTVSVSKPLNRDSVSEVTLTINGTPLGEATALTANAGQEVIASADSVTVGVQGGYPHQEVTA